MDSLLSVLIEALRTIFVCKIEYFGIYRLWFLNALDNRAYGCVTDPFSTFLKSLLEKIYED